MKNRNYYSIALVILAAGTILTIGIMAGIHTTTAGFAYDFGYTAGKLARPYLIGVGIVALILIALRIFAKKSGTVQK